MVIKLKHDYRKLESVTCDHHVKLKTELRTVKLLIYHEYFALSCEQEQSIHDRSMSYEYANMLHKSFTTNNYFPL